MTEHKYTDEEVIKALECCSKSGMLNCRACPYEASCNMGESKMQAHALDLINRQKAEVAFWMDAAANAKKEAVKEFAEKLKKELTTGAAAMRVSTLDIINDLVKELTEEKT